MASDACPSLSDGRPISAHSRAGPLPQPPQTMRCRDGPSATICRWPIGPLCGFGQQPLTTTPSSLRWPATPALLKTGLFPDPDDDEVLAMLPPPGSCRSSPRIGASCPLVRCGRTTAVRHCAPVRMARRCPNSALVSHPDGVAVGLAACFWTRLFADLSPQVEMICTNVHVRNPAKRLYERKGFREVGQGNGPLGLVMIKDLR